MAKGAPVGLFDRLTRKSTSFRWKQSSAARFIEYDFSFGSFQWPSRTTTSTAPVLAERDARWYGPGDSVEVAGLRLPGGMIYVGNTLPSARGWNEPSLIVPGRRADLRKPDRGGQQMYYRLGYESMARSSRGAYLEWLAEGRRNPATSASYPFLFLCGLERRVLVDIAEDDALLAELPAIRAEAQALLDLYGDRDYHFATRAGNFVSLVDLMGDDLAGEVIGEPPPLGVRTWEVPLALRIGLGRFVARRQPIPAAWALSWGWHHPEIPQWMPMLRCTAEFARMFPIRYREAFGDGLLVRPGKRAVAFHYHPANSTLGGGSVELPGIPDVFHHRGPAGKLLAVVAQASTDLDAYSRWTGDRPERRRRLPALARLPAPLIDDSVEEIRRFRGWVNGQLAGAGTAVLPGSALIAQWQLSGPDRPVRPVRPDRLTKPDATFLAYLLGHLGFGIEPDVRFGGQPIAAQRPAVLFRLEGAAPGSDSTVSAAYSAATVLAQLAAAVNGASAADGVADGNPSDRIASLLRLSGPERARLDAHATMLANTDVTLTGLTKRLDALGDAGRAAIGEMLLALVTGASNVSPARVTMLMKIYRTLKLDPATVPGRLHARMTEARPSPARDPVLVRPGGAAEPGFRLPSEDRPAASPAGHEVALDHDAVRQRLADSEAVAALLGDIFAEPDDRAVPPAAAPGPAPAADGASPDDVAFPGLDLAHSRLLRDLAARDGWARAEFDALAGRYHLMPDGALDSLN